MIRNTNTSQLRLFLQHRLTLAQLASIQFLRNRSLILVMSALQLTWLLLIAGTGASTKYTTLLVVALISVLATSLVLFLPARTMEKIHNLKTWLVQSEKRSLLFLCIVALLIGVLYSARENQWEDEKANFKAANIIATDGIPLAYHRVGWLGKQHPPLFPLISAWTLKLPGPDLFYMRLVSVFFLAGTLVVTYFLGSELYSQEIGFLASILMLSYPLVVRLSASAMMDIEVTFFFALALLLLVRLSRNPSYKVACAAGLVIGLGLLTKYMMVFIFVVLFSYFVCFQSFRRIKAYLFVAFAVSMAIFSIWLLYANHFGLLYKQFEKISSFIGTFHVVRNFEQSIQDAPSTQPIPNEVQSPTPMDVMQNGIFRLGLESIFTRIPSSLGVYHAPLILFGLIYILKRRNPADLLLLLWIGTVSVSLFLTLPDHRYFLPIFPAIALAAAHILIRFPDYAEKVILLSLFFAAGDLYMFADWVRESHIFLLTP